MLHSQCNGSRGRLRENVGGDEMRCFVLFGQRIQTSEVVDPFVPQPFRSTTYLLRTSYLTKVP